MHLGSPAQCAEFLRGEEDRIKSRVRMVNLEQSREEVIGDNVKDYSPFR
jgi:hypothetical protein